jgi:hypothetical protein
MSKTIRHLSKVSNSWATFCLSNSYFHISGFPLTEDLLREAAEISGILDVLNDFLQPHFRQTCEEILPSVNDTKPNEFVEKILFLKENFSQQQCH